MKVLIVSHNVMNPVSNMGKTLRSYFQTFQRGDIAQFYIHSEVPVEDSLCQNYYRFTDLDAIKSIFPFHSYGRIFHKKEIQPKQITGRTDTGILRCLYRYGEKRTALVYALRNLLWKCSRWNTKPFWTWVDDFGPDVIFFASGDYAFLYDVAREIADHTKKPLVVSCVDDHYLYNRNEDCLLGRIGHRIFLKTVTKTMARSSAVFTICPALQREYQRLFRKKCYVLPTSAVQENARKEGARLEIAYLGNLEYHRNQQLIAIGHALQGMDIPGVPRFVDVYSTERNLNLLKAMTQKNGIRFHGAASTEKVLEILQTSMAVIHTESFDPRIREIIRYSVSTKIPESLMNGPCIIAYGPEGIASIDYLKENRAAYTITDPGLLQHGLQEILTNKALRREICLNARNLAMKNHHAQTNSNNLKNWLTQICKEQWSDESAAD